MTFVVSVEMDNAAFADLPGTELARVLRVLARQVEHDSLQPGDRFPLRDINGNTVGEGRVRR